jgi:predicted transposase/invertase (TIGR01784 family)
MPPLGIDPKVDYAFKKLFGSEGTRDLLAHALNAVLQPPPGSEIVDPVVLNPFNEKETASDKLTVLDIRARDASGRTFHVEMQMEAFWTFPGRVLYYWARAHSTQLTEGTTFGDLKPTVSVCFVGNQLFRDTPGYHHKFRVIDPGSGLVFTDHLGIHILELGKFSLTADRVRTPLEMWCYFLRHGQELDRANLPAPLNVPWINRALEVLQIMTHNDIEREQYESRWRAMLEERSRMVDARREAMEQGLKEGREEGRNEGRGEGALVERVRFAQAVLKLPVTPEEELYRMPREELKALADRLTQQVMAGRS